MILMGKILWVHQSRRATTNRTGCPKGWSLTSCRPKSNSFSSWLPANLLDSSASEWSISLFVWPALLFMTTGWSVCDLLSLARLFWNLNLFLFWSQKVGTYQILTRSFVIPSWWARNCWRSWFAYGFLMYSWSWDAFQRKGMRTNLFKVGQLGLSEDNTSSWGLLLLLLLSDDHLELEHCAKLTGKRENFQKLWKRFRSK